MASTSKTLTNSAHEPGYTCITFSRDGRLSYTGGSDSLVRIWQMDKDQYQEPEVAYEADEGITALASADDYWLSGSKDSEVRSYPHGKPDLHGLIMNAAGVCVRALAVDPTGKRVAIATDETTVKIIDLDEITNVTALTGHKKCVRKVTWHPSGTLLTASGADGTITVWDISEREPRVDKLIEGVIPVVADTESPEFMHDCSAVWHPSGQYFLTGSRTHEIVAISRPNWEKSSTFSDANTTGVTTALALSLNGVYLASACKEEILVWSTQTKRVLWRHASSPNALTTQIAFSPSQNLLAWADTEGILTWWRDPIPTGSPDPVKKSAAGSMQGVPLMRKSTPTLWGEDTADAGRGAGAEDGNDYGDDWIIDDLGVGMEDDQQDGPHGRQSGNGFVKEMVSITKAQPAFQPGSTPMEGKKRYLAYNMVGWIDITDQDTHHILNVGFHDLSTRKSYHFSDPFKYDAGYLGERGVLLACPPEQDHPAQVLYKPYGTWSTQGDWTYVLPAGHHVLGLAAGGERPMRSLRDPSSSGGDIQGLGNIVIATSAGDLTFLSGSGLERIVLGLEGEYVTMAAGEEYVVVVHRPGATTIDGSQGLMATLISFEDFEVLQAKPLPIPKGHVLKWIGITDEGAPAIYDSAGYAHLMINFRRPNRAIWARLLDTNTLERKQGKDESYWPVGLSQDTFTCVILKGRQEHPGFPRPLTQELPVRLPFRNKDAVESPIEEKLARERIHINQARDALGDELTSSELDKREIELDKSIIKLIQAACKLDKAPRVLELTKRLHFTHSIAAASQLAGFYKLIGLQEKIEAIKRWREDGPTPVEEARERRRELEQEDAYMAHPKPFQDFKPPPRIERPGLARSTGVIERTEFTASNAAVRGFRARVAQTPARSASPEGKRKRDEEDDPASNGSETDAKRRAVEESHTIIPSPKREEPSK
ncbi:WD40 repeat-like protein [Paxillus ammoniavirescens]|nr:WD40 repeat-like protein [Paxillus ammoniavirescens]